MTNQNIIRERYAAELAEAKERLCLACRHYQRTLVRMNNKVREELWECIYGLRPLTTKGEDCPYWKKRENA